VAGLGGGSCIVLDGNGQVGKRSCVKVNGVGDVLRSGWDGDVGVGVEGVDGVPAGEGSGDFDLESEFTVRCEDGALVKVQGWAVDVTVLES